MLNEVNKLLGVWLARLAVTHTLNILQFLERDRIVGCHLLDGHILENNVWRTVELARPFLTQVMEHGTQRGVERTCSALRAFLLFVELMVEHDHERLGRLHELLAGGSKLQQTVVLDILLQIASDERLPNDGIPDFRILVLAHAELFELMMLMGIDLIGLAAHDEADDIVATEILLDRLHRFQYGDQLFAGLALGAGMQTIIAVVAVVLFVVLTKVVEQHLTPTHRGLGIGCRLLQQLSAYVLLGHGLALHELIELLQVLVAIESQTDALSAVASGTARLLIVALKRLGYVVVNDEAHIGLVDAHAKGNGSHNNINLLHEEVVLSLRARGAVKPGMISLSLDVVGTQHVGQVLHFFA